MSKYPVKPIVKEITVKGNILLIELEPTKFKSSDEYFISYGNDYDEAFSGDYYKKLTRNDNFIRFRTTWLPTNMCFSIITTRAGLLGRNKVNYMQPSEYIYINTEIQGKTPISYTSPFKEVYK